MAVAIPVYLTIPSDSPLGPALLEEVIVRQKKEWASAKAENRLPNNLTIQDVILILCAEKLGVKVPVRRKGRPKKNVT